MTKLTKTFLAAPLLAATFGLAPLPADAQQQTGLINVNVQGVAVPIQVPVGIAANVCNVQVAALIAAARQGDSECDADADSAANSEIFQRFATRQGVNL